MARPRITRRQPRDNREGGCERSTKDSELQATASDQLPDESASNVGSNSDDPLPTPITSDVTFGHVREELVVPSPQLTASPSSSLAKKAEEIEVSLPKQSGGVRRKRKAKREAVKSSNGDDEEQPQPKRKRGQPRLQPQEAPESPTITSDKEWEVEKIVGSFIEAGTLTHYYEVKWRGFSSKHNTWEPRIGLQNCKEAIGEFESCQQRSARRWNA